MMVYLDTSTVLRVLLAQGKRLDAWGKWEAAWTSELMGVEVRRVIDRLRLGAALDDDGVALAHTNLAAIEATIGRIALSRAVLRRAALPMATAVKTLDAIHLATAMLLQERRGHELVFATHDGQQATAARALGFECRGV